MTGRKNKTWIVSTAMAVFAPVAVYCATARPKADNQAHHEAATLSAQQILVRAAPICGLLNSGSGTFKQTCELLQRVGADGAKHQLWTVGCIDAAGNCVANTTWDAETGNLLIATHTTPRCVPGKKPLFAPDGVARTAWQWMETLGVGKTAARWTSPQQPKLIGNTWIVVLRSDRYRVSVLLDRDSHDLIYMTVKPASEAVRTS